jgi:hypothetical protein
VGEDTERGKGVLSSDIRQTGSGWVKRQNEGRNMKKETCKEETGNSNGVGKNKHHHPTKPDVRTGLRYFWAQRKGRSEGPDHAHS